MVYDFIVQFEDSGTKSVQECCDYLLEIINIVDDTTKEARLDIAFPGLIYKDKDEELKNFQAINIINQDEIFNDGVYEYDQIGLPFFGQLGRAVYAYECTRKRSHPANLSRYRVLK